VDGGCRSEGNERKDEMGGSLLRPCDSKHRRRRERGKVPLLWCCVGRVV
jgi:hypothetical protein